MVVSTTPPLPEPFVHETAVGLAAIVVLGVLAQLVADRLKLPSILLLLIVGVVAGPLTGFLDPDELMGDLLPPLVSLAVGIILFEGGLNLKIRQLAGLGRTTWSLVTVGVAITWGILALAAWLVVDMPLPMAVLAGAILVVSGPTVIIPLLRQLGPSKRVKNVLTWEAIFIDPVGAMLAVIVFETIIVEEGIGAPFLEMGRFVLTGAGIGVVLAAIMAFLLGRFWIPDYLRTGVTLAVVVLAFTVSNELAPESGLLATTVLGLALANQPWTPMADIAEFSENLQVLLIAALFVVLSARLDLDEIVALGWPIVAFVAIMVLVARPLAVAASTIGSQLERNEKVFLAAMAPRGIVAASVASVFALQLEARGVEGAGLLVPVTFAAIAATVAIYGLSARWLGRRLGVAEPDPQGVLVVGGDGVAVTIAQALDDAGVKVKLLAGNRSDHYRARMAELDADYANVLGSHDTDDLIPPGIGQALVVTHNDEYNALASVRLAELLGPQHVYQIVPDRDSESGPTPDTESLLRGRWLFDMALSHNQIDQRLREGWTVNSTSLTESFGGAEFQEVHGTAATPLFFQTTGGAIVVVTADSEPIMTPGQTVLALVPPR
jgi:NhaP-type Na+/H+ or K+/H+ antiporter